MKHLKATIYGRVQGVFFRDSARQKARELGLTGWVANQADGSVYLEAEGEEEKLKELLAWCWQGSSSARVDKVEQDFSQELKNFEGFEVRY